MMVRMMMIIIVVMVKPIYRCRKRTLSSLRRSTMGESSQHFKFITKIIIDKPGVHPQYISINNDLL